MLTPMQWTCRAALTISIRDYRAASSKTVSQRALTSILQQLRISRGGLTQPELALRLGASISTVSPALGILVRSGQVVRHAGLGRAGAGRPHARYVLA
jgi:DNA-binding MarR family transcriptional regulator